MTQVKRRFRILAIKAIFREEIMAYCVAYRRVMAARFPELNNMSEQTRMSDLFHKNDRTEHYTWKVHPSPPPRCSSRGGLGGAALCCRPVAATATLEGSPSSSLGAFPVGEMLSPTARVDLRAAKRPVGSVGSVVGTVRCGAHPKLEHPRAGKSDKGGI
jgi:hypothetical protein